MRSIKRNRELCQLGHYLAKTNLTKSQRFNILYAVKRQAEKQKDIQEQIQQQQFNF
ncbi:hypothetical protein AAEX28_04070 [Lentisphaerota bacterium WC36G]|nr:hypothetical protein LJT99_06940 [Lentisphaerae bacterium WC36]